jgi:hypothetical protein
MVSGCTRTGKPDAQFVACPGEHIAIDDGVEHKAVFSTHQAIDGLSTAKLSGERGYAFAFRRGDVIGVGAAMPDRTPIGGLVTLSRGERGGERGEPVIIARSEGVLVGWAERARASEPWSVHLVRWVPGLGPETVDVQTSALVDDAPPALRFGKNLTGEHTLLADATQSGDVQRVVAKR